MSGERGKANPLYRHNIQVRVPMDDTHTRVYRVNFVPMPNERSPADGDAPWELLDSSLPHPLPYMPYSLLTLPDRPGLNWCCRGGLP